MLINNISGNNCTDELRELFKDGIDGVSQLMILKSSTYKFNHDDNLQVAGRNVNYPNNYVEEIKHIYEDYNHDTIIVIDANEAILNKLFIYGIVPDKIICESENKNGIGN